ncbi:WxL domain surface cell wall-binding [Pilibacter termitis]|uniref:WxL domain surface cell wall-binding n=1 Tax=Pilibacter termitis TaxID=263852 RepID=A0A1T4MWJ6_9ENTE|nr:WxL domain-containing protein [Pilibacter termitis]SJZ71177.1 WxL domain surface cell wall-binding [Pilibacter termitis]
MKKTAVLSLSALALATVALPMVTSALDDINTNPKVTSKSSANNLTPQMEAHNRVSFQGVNINNGGLVLEEVPGYDFSPVTATTINTTGYTFTASGIREVNSAGVTQDNTPQGIVVTDLRGGTTGYKVSMEVKDLSLTKGGNSYLLPVNTFKVSVKAGSFTDAGGNVIPTHAAKTGVDTYKVKGEVITSTAQATGTITSEIPDVTMDVGQQGITSGTYTGVVEYTLEDGKLP